jgi:hypothetical protein
LLTHDLARLVRSRSIGTTEFGREVIARLG